MFKATDAFLDTFTRQSSAEIKSHISSSYCIDENQYVEELLRVVKTDYSDTIADDAGALIEQVRSQNRAIDMIDSLLLEYGLDSEEGVLLMCLAEALMRIPDTETAEALINDRLTPADWNKHLGNSQSLLVNATTWGLVLTGKVVTLDKATNNSPTAVIDHLIKRLGEPVIRKALHQAMGMMGKHFVAGRYIEEALDNCSDNLNTSTLHKANTRNNVHTYSFDMLGEAALTRADADQYLQNYLHAITCIGKHNDDHSYLYDTNNRLLPSVSIKLSALHPRYEDRQKKRVMSELYQTVMLLIDSARELNVGITIDAEEMDRLELSLDLFEKLYQSEQVKGWGYLGIAVQAYSKRALPTLTWLAALAREQGDLIPVRLVKGAYWDAEIKKSQQTGLIDYPVFTRKEATDLSYLACSLFLFSSPAKERLYPQFATHNAHTIACITQIATHTQYEFQRLYGMGDALYGLILSSNHKDKKIKNVRTYAPVGAHASLLPYLVRRLLENGSNSSFVHRLLDLKTPISNLVHHPASLLQEMNPLRNNNIPLPADIFGSERKNSIGINVDITSQWSSLRIQIDDFKATLWRGGPIINGDLLTASKIVEINSPHKQASLIGRVSLTELSDVTQAIDAAHSAFAEWNNTSVETRANYLYKMADQIETNMPELIALCQREAGKVIQDSIDEIREAIDFCRYYASQAQSKFSAPKLMQSPTGETNELYLQGRGVFACISPWNFPLAIFVGQIAAALVTGNTVIAKPAEQTSLIATRTIEMLHKTGIPTNVVHLLTGEGAVIGDAIIQDRRIAGVAFTGSTTTAMSINRTLAARNSAIAPLIAETGGQNAMIIDSTALPEQAIQDVVTSAFKSAGQRCSSLRVVYIQQDIAPRMLDLLKGVMAELTIGDPSLPETDIGPVIDLAAKQRLLDHIDTMRTEAALIYETPLAYTQNKECFVAPIAFQIDNMSQLKGENFGPVLHVIIYKLIELNKVIAQINDSGYGLTLGIHSRNDTTARYIESQVRVGNVYINRNQIGATVGVQPFGGLGLSGTGPKAGGPYYLLRFATEKTRTINTTAVGGNAALLSLGNNRIND